MTTGVYTSTHSETFTVTNAWHIVAKIGTDLKRMQRFYRMPSDKEIDDYEKEAVFLLRGDYLESVTYGFQRHGSWVVALKYEARYGGVLIADDSPGKIPLGVDVSGCEFQSVLRGTRKWRDLDEDQKDWLYAKAGISWRRVLGKGYTGNWRVNKTYSAGGRGVVRYASS